MEALIEELQELPSVRVVVFTGGEPFLLKERLAFLISKANSQGLVTRCVTNAYWATTRKTAARVLSPLVAAGLKELNLSTGYFHSRFVPVANVVNAALTSVELGIAHVLINVELVEGVPFDPQLLTEDSGLKAHIDAGRVVIKQSAWIANCGREPLSYPPGQERFAEANMAGCQTVMTVLAVTPDQRLAACCGLHLEKIPDLYLGSVANSTIKEIVAKAPDDFLKIWLHVEGPERILKWVQQHAPDLELPQGSVHPCESCMFLFGSRRARETIRQNYAEVVPRVLPLYMAALAGQALREKLVPEGLIYSALGRREMPCSENL